MATTMMMLMIGSQDDTREFKAEETASAGSVGLRQSTIAARNTASSPKDEEGQPTVILRRSNGHGKWHCIKDMGTMVHL